MPSPHLKRVHQQDLPKAMQKAWEDSTALRNEATFFEVMGNNPELYQWYIEQFYGGLFHSGKVEVLAKELLKLRLSIRHGCKFCNQGNRLNAKAAGLTDEKIDALFADNLSVFSASEQAIITLADRISLDQPTGILDHALHGRLSEFYSDAQILELGMVAGILTGMAKFLFAFDLVEQEENCSYQASSTP